MSMHSTSLAIFCALLLFALLCLSACVSVPVTESVATQLVQDSTQSTGLFLAGENVAQGFRNNSIYDIDTSSSIKLASRQLHRSNIRDFSVDTNGNVWLGYSGGMDYSDDRVQILSPDLEQIKEIRPCSNPTGSVHFADGLAFIVCSKDGFSGSVVIVDTSSFDVIDSIELSMGESPFMVTTSSANEDYIIVAGLTSGTEETSYTQLFVVDIASWEVFQKLGPLPDTDIWTILPYEDEFILLNVGSWRSSIKDANDLIFLDVRKPISLTTRALFPSPLWGVISDDILYVYHDQTWNQPNDVAERLISSIDLRSNTISSWKLPLAWSASDVAYESNRLFFAHWEGISDDQDGIYTFDFDTEKLRLFIKIPDVSRIVFPSDSQ